jgi:beta-lactamase class A
MRRVLVALLLLAIVPATSSAASCWGARVTAAERIANAREGRVAFALIDADGKLHERGGRATFRTASLLKPLLLATYLRRSDVRGRSLTKAERALLDPMIRRSDSDAASTILGRLSATAIARTARASGQRQFRLITPIWGLSRTSAVDQARFFRNLDAVLPARHRAYAHRLLRTIVASQRWGVGKARPAGWGLEFKGGWGSGTGQVNSQTARLTRGGQLITLAVMTESNPSHAYGSETIRRIAAKLVRPQPCPPR